MKTNHTERIIYALILLSLLTSLTACSNTLKVSMGAEGFMWNPSEIHAKVNQPIEITLHNSGALDHEFLIEELDIAVRVRPNEIKVVTLTIDHPGVVKYVCKIPGHEEAGMVGVIIITN